MVAKEKGIRIIGARDDQRSNQMVTVRRASLTVHRGPTDRMTILMGGRPILLGRRPDNEVVIGGPHVSRRHALIVETSYGFVLRDLSSANGTYVDGDRIGNEPHLLRSGAEIRLGGSPVTLVFRQEATSRVVLETESMATPA